MNRTGASPARVSLTGGVQRITHMGMGACGYLVVPSVIHRGERDRFIYGVCNPVMNAPMGHCKQCHGTSTSELTHTPIYIQISAGSTLSMAADSRLSGSSPGTANDFAAFQANELPRVSVPHPLPARRNVRSDGKLHRVDGSDRVGDCERFRCFPSTRNPSRHCPLPPSLRPHAQRTKRLRGACSVTVPCFADVRWSLRTLLLTAADAVRGIL
jgi:hypothetical protein